MTQMRIGTIAILFFVFYGIGMGASLTLGIQWFSKSGPWTVESSASTPISWQGQHQMPMPACAG